MPALVLPPPPHHLPPDDLLAETLAQLEDSPELLSNDYTDDLEDIVSMSVAQQLHSRRSHSTMQTFLPSSPPTASPPLGSFGSNGRFSSPSSPANSAASETDESYFRPTNGAVNGGAGAGKNGKRRPSAIPRPGGGGGKSQHSSPEASRKGSLVPPSDSEDGGDKWETLQVGSPTTSSFPSGNGAGGRAPKTPSPSPSRSATVNGNALSSSGASPPLAAQARKSSIPNPSASNSLARAKTVDFPPSSEPPPTRIRRPSVGNPSKPSSSPTAGASSGTNGSPAPRKRAITASATASPPNGSTSPQSSPPTSSRAPLKPTQLQPRPTKASQSRSVPLPGQPPVRRKSLSTAQELAALRARAGVDEVTGLPLPSGGGGAYPDWANDPAPIVYRTSKGDLAFASSAAEDLRKLRPEDRVLPAVARRLEAERLAALAKELGTGDTDNELLVNEWGTDGTPRSAVSWNSKARSSASGQGSAAPTSPAPLEEADTSSTPPEPPLERGQYPPLPSPPSTSQSQTPSSPSRQPSQYLHQSPRRRPSQQVSLSPLPTPPAVVDVRPTAPSSTPQRNDLPAPPGQTEKGAKQEPQRPLPPVRQQDQEEKGAGCCRCVIC